MLHVLFQAVFADGRVLCTEDLMLEPRLPLGSLFAANPKTHKIVVVNDDGSSVAYIRV